MKTLPATWTSHSFKFWQRGDTLHHEEEVVTEVEVMEVVLSQEDNIVMTM